jgi:hypothetical protein
MSNELDNGEGKFVISNSEGGRQNEDKSKDPLCGLIPGNKGVNDVSKEIPLFVDDIRREMGIDGDSRAITSVIAKLYDFSQTRAPVLLVGQRGVGKKRFAHFFHRLTSQSSTGYLIISSKTLIKSGLGALNVNDYLANMEAERQKTIIFDHPELLSNILCNNILSPFCEQGQVSRTRIVLIVDSQALSRFLFSLTSKGRVALQARLVSVPPLHERHEDLRRHILARVRDLNRIYGIAKRIAINTLDYMCGCKYPRNFHSLHALIDKLYVAFAELISCDESLISKELAKGVAGNFFPEIDGGFHLEKFLGCVRQKIVWRTLERANYNQTVCAELLGVTPQAINKFLHSQKFHKPLEEEMAKKEGNTKGENGS